MYNALTGAYVKTIGKKGKGEGELSYPTGLCMLPPSTDRPDTAVLFIAEYGNHRIQAFHADTGEHLGFIGLGQGREIGQLNRPYGLCMLQLSTVAENSNEVKLYVADMGNSRVQVFHLSSDKYSCS